MTTVEAGGREASVRLPAVGSRAEAREVAVSVGQGDPLLESLAQELLAGRHAVPLHQLLEHAAGPGVDRATLEALYRELRGQGYLARAGAVADVLSVTAPGAGSRRRSAHATAELAVLRDPVLDAATPPEGWRGGVVGTVLLVMGRSLPDVTTTYAQHVHRVAEGLKELGLRVEVASELGFRAAEGAYRTEGVDGVRYHRLPGPVRSEVPLDDWLDSSAHKLAAIVRKVRPAALVAHSDFLNVLPALRVARGYGLPLVYDVSGDWDASWFRRQQEVLGWPDVATLATSSQGLPERYELRRERERAAWRAVDRVIVSGGGRAQVAAVTAELAGAGRVPVAATPHDVLQHAGVLEELGAAPAGLRALAGVVVDADSRAALSARAATHRRPLERQSRLADAEAVRRTTTTGWEWNGLPPVSLDLPVDWRGACASHRSQDYQLHAWAFMGPVLDQVERTDDAELLEWCVQRALSWCRTVLGEPAPEMAWYDMALAWRAPRLAHLFERALTQPSRTPEELDELHRGVLAHQRALLSPSSFNGETNHGLYTALGQIAFARRLAELPGMAEIAEQGRSRLREVVRGQLAADGGHREHSPDYHRMVVDSLADAIGDDLIEDPELVALVDRAAHVTGWFVRPDGEIEQIGDSPARTVARSTRSRRDPVTDFVVTAGRSGTPPEAESLLLPDSGFAVVRSPRPTTTQELREASYLTFTGAFHSRTHKHADDLAVTWFDGGRELLLDSGRFGYLDVLPGEHPDRDQGFYYGRPERQYVEGTRAHNTVSADGEDHDRRTRAPYGSAVREVRREGAVHVVTGEVDHGHWRHRRVVRLEPGVRLDVEDEVTSLDGADHTFETWWNLPGDLELVPTGGAGRHTGATPGDELLLTGGGTRLRVVVADAARPWRTARGAQEPLLGWRSREDYALTPCWNLSRGVVARHHVFTTSFVLGDRS